MTATTIPTETTETTTRPASSLRRTTVVGGLVAAAVTTAAAAAVHAAGVSFEIEGESIPMFGFAQMTFVGAVIGGLLLAGLNRWSGSSRSVRTRFLQVTVGLTVLSCVPSVALPDDAGSAVALVALHVLAAALIVPALARHARG